jgi:hypothetical protein
VYGITALAGCQLSNATTTTTATTATTNHKRYPANELKNLGFRKIEIAEIIKKKENRKPPSF